MSEHPLPEGSANSPVPPPREVQTSGQPTVRRKFAKWPFLIFLPLVGLPFVPWCASRHVNDDNNEKAETEDDDPAVAVLSQFIRQDPRNHEAYRDRGSVWLTRKKYRAAIKDFTKAIELEPRDAAAYSFRGDAWNALREYDKAVSDYSAVLR